MQEELNKLYELKGNIESEAFQEYLCKPLRKEQDKLHLNFFSDSIKDSWRKGGKFEGIQMFFKLLEQVNSRIEDLKDELESQQE